MPTTAENQTIYGTSGEDFLSGDIWTVTEDGTWVQVSDPEYILAGGAGNDVYWVTPNDSVIEGVDEGVEDWVFASGDYVLTPGAQVEILGTWDGDATDPLNLTGNEFNDLIVGNQGANILRGGGGYDRLRGDGGDDTLDGGTGADRMDGGAGNDTYYVDDAGDVIVESVGGGYDIVRAYQSYTLAEGVSVEALTTRNPDSTMAIDLGGNSFDNLIYGTNGTNVISGGGGDDRLFAFDGNDTLIGGAGSDRMDGGAGNDTYYVDDAGDVIVESVGGGYDIVRAYQSYTLAEGVSVEALTTRNPDSTMAIDLGGNSFDNLIYGTNGTNVISGGGGDDRLFAFDGNDTLIGGAGADQLTGGAGNDRFVFNAASESTVAAPDRILDFASGDLIDFSAIDANGSVDGDQAFSFVGSATFSNTAGELRAYESPTGSWMVEGDINGDGIADFLVQVTSSTPLGLADFVI